MEYGADGGQTWQDARLGERVGRHGWWAWSYDRDTDEPGEYELCIRAADSAGNTQPLDASEVWNTGTYGINTVRRVTVVVRWRPPERGPRKAATGSSSGAGKGRRRRRG